MISHSFWTHCRFAWQLNLATIWKFLGRFLCYHFCLFFVFACVFVCVCVIKHKIIFLTNFAATELNPWKRKLCRPVQAEQTFGKRVITICNFQFDILTSAISISPFFISEMKQVISDSLISNIRSITSFKIFKTDQRHGRFDFHHIKTCFRISVKIRNIVGLDILPINF